MSEIKKHNGEESIINLPDNLFVECPIIEKRLRNMQHCAACEHHKGLHDRFPTGKAPSEIPMRSRYLVSCNYPTARAMFETEKTQ